jgi:hypothetical protein
VATTVTERKVLDGPILDGDAAEVAGLEISGKVEAEAAER